jgi:signal transduction histidine kinase
MLEPLKKSRQQQTEFIASASHELRTPVTVIQSSLSALGKANEEEAPRFYNSIESECVRMSRLISDLLSLASTDSFTISTQLKKIEIDTLLLDVTEKFDLLAKEKGMRISLKLPPGKVPQIKGDALRLTQVFAILLDNAISYSGENGQIQLSLELLKSRVKIQVADNGPGISDEQKDKIWERFYRGDPSRKSEGHFGLGLAIAKEIVGLHKGKISVNDNPGGGSVFMVSLPIY